MRVKSLGSNQTEVTTNDGTQVLISYSTPVACFIPGQGYYITGKNHSKTTSKHILKYIGEACFDIQDQTFFDSLL